MGKFSVLDFLLSEAELEDQENDQTGNPMDPQAQSQVAGGNPNSMPQNVQGGAPGQETSQMKGQSSPFGEFSGNTIKSINFKRNGAEGGQIIIATTNTGRPVVISWMNDTVTLTKPNGDVIALT